MGKKNFDLMGVAAAVLCLLHCLLLPLLIVLPLGLGHNAFIDLFFALLGFWAVYRVTAEGASRSVRILLWSSVGLVGLSVFLDLLFHVHSPLIYVGAAGLIAGHVIRLRGGYRIRHADCAEGHRH